MRENRLGILGHYYGGMLDVYTDITRQSAVFGTHLEMLEMCELKRFREQLTEDDVNAKLGEFRSNFEVSPECEDSELRRAAATSAALAARMAGLCSSNARATASNAAFFPFLPPPPNRRDAALARLPNVSRVSMMESRPFLSAGGRQ